MKIKNKILIAPEISKIIRRLCDGQIQDPPITFASISRKTGVSTAWLQKLAAGGIVDPSYSKIKILKEFFNI